jgi:hypothetical protein
MESQAQNYQDDRPESERSMPTTLPPRARKKPDLFFAFLFALASAFFVIELVDPAPMNLEAAMFVAP